MVNSYGTACLRKMKFLCAIDMMRKRISVALPLLLKTRYTFVLAQAQKCSEFTARSRLRYRRHQCSTPARWLYYPIFENLTCQLLGRVKPFRVLTCCDEWDTLMWLLQRTFYIHVNYARNIHSQRSPLFFLPSWKNGQRKLFAATRQTSTPSAHSMYCRFSLSPSVSFVTDMTLRSISCFAVLCFFVIILWNVLMSTE